jgi:hypothetical protein
MTAHRSSSGFTNLSGAISCISLTIGASPRRRLASGGGTRCFCVTPVSAPPCSSPPAGSRNMPSIGRQPPALFPHVAAAVRGFDLVGDCVRQRHFGHLVRVSRLFRAPALEGQLETPELSRGRKPASIGPGVKICRLFALSGPCIHRCAAGRCGAQEANDVRLLLRS